MMNTQTQSCQPERLEALLRSELSPGDEQALMLHLSDCESCRRELDRHAADVTSWDEAQQFLQPPANPSTSGHAEEETLPRSLQIETVLDALAPTDDPEMLGRLGGYEVSGVIGSGAMGVVLKGFDRSLERAMAIKVMSPHLASSGPARKRFAREAKAAAAVLHPNVMAIHSVSTDDVLPYLVMPYVGSSSLQKRIDSHGPLSAEAVLRVGSQIAAGLAAAHAQGIVHRDIKPANVLVEDGVERVAITDFGLARAVDDATMTRSGMIAGTPQYMSPQQARGESIDQRSDLFSLGSVLYAMCTGRPPFRADTTFGVLRRITDDEPRPIREIHPGVPEWLCAIINRLLAKEADDRFQSAAEVAELLESCLAHVQQPTVVPLPARAKRLLACETESVRRRKSFTAGNGNTPRTNVRRWLAGAVCTLAALAAGVLVVLESNKGDLIIRSEADDVPIRIMQGEEVVERLTVSRTGAGVRVAAGTYVVEIDGAPDGIVINGGRVTLKRRGEVVVSIVTKAKPGDGTSKSLFRMQMRTPPGQANSTADLPPMSLQSGGARPDEASRKPATRSGSGRMPIDDSDDQGSGAAPSPAAELDRKLFNELIGRDLDFSAKSSETEYLQILSALKKAEALERAHRYKEAAAQYKKLADQYRSRQVALSMRFRRARCLLFLGETTAARAILHELLLTAPKATTLRSRIFKIYDELGAAVSDPPEPDESSERNVDDAAGKPGANVLTADEVMKRSHALSESGRPITVRFRVGDVFEVYEKDLESMTLIVKSKAGKKEFDDQALHVWLPKNVRAAFKLRGEDFVGRQIEVKGIVVYTGAGPAFGPDLYSIKVRADDQIRVLESRP